MSALWVLLGLVILQRLTELIIAHRNTARLLAQGAVEHGRRHYPIIVGLHVSWLIVMATAIPSDTPVNVIWLAIFLALQAARVWVLWALGPYWTTQVITVPGAPLVRRGPYKFIKHPNYVIVAFEIFALPMVFGATEIAITFFLVNALILWHRIKVENAALASRRDPGDLQK